MSENHTMPGDAVRIISLGGIGTIGKNMTLLEHQDSIIIIDCGLMFPDEEHPGVDVILPDMTYVLENADRVAGVVLTHGHEDHIGALPYLLEQLPLPVYGTRLTLGLLTSKLEEYRPLEGYSLHEIQPRETFALGSFEIEPVRLSHSIPDVLGLGIHTNAGLVLHSGDFKFDQTPINADGPDFIQLADFGKRGVALLLSDCTNVERPGFSPSERIVGEALYRVFRDAPGRVIVTTFASNVSRVQQVIKQSIACGRMVAVTGRSMLRIMETARKLGYLHVADEVLINIEDVEDYEPEQVTVLTTGSQGEPLSALSRMARGSHRHVNVKPGDTVVMSATPIPGNESLIWRTINRLFGQGARVIYGSDQGVHVTGHGYREEIKLMLSLTRPQSVIPIHGDQRHLALYAELAERMGIAPSNIFQLYPGASVEVRPDKAYRGPTVHGGSVNVDGLGVGDVGDVVLSDRQILASEGIFLPVLVIKRDTIELLAPPEVYSRGFVYMDESEELISEAKEHVLEIVQQLQDEGENDPEVLFSTLRTAMGRFLYRATERRPMILPVIIPIGDADDEATAEGPADADEILEYSDEEMEPWNEEDD